MDCISLLRLSKVYFIFLDSDLYLHHFVVHTFFFFMETFQVMIFMYFRIICYIFFTDIL